MDIDRAAIEAEADRLLAVFIRIRVLSQTRKLDFTEAGLEAVRNGLVSEEDWAVIREV
jgi:hypothetical protein